MAVDKRNIFLSGTEETLDFSRESRPIGHHYPQRDVKPHADFVQKKLKECYERADVGLEGF